MANAGGRPPKYGPDMIERTHTYVEGYSEDGDEIPSIAGLSIELGVTRETVHTWKNDEEKVAFSDIVKELLAKQERILVNKGLKGDFNASITKLLLTKHGYHDKQEVDQTTAFTVTIGEKDAGTL